MINMGLMYCGQLIYPKIDVPEFLKIKKVTKDLTYIKYESPGCFLPPIKLVYFDAGHTYYLAGECSHFEMLQIIAKIIHPKQINAKRTFMTLRENYDQFNKEQKWHKLCVLEKLSLVINDEPPNKIELKKLEILENIIKEYKTTGKVNIPRPTSKKEKSRIKLPQKVKVKLPIRRLI